MYVIRNIIMFIAASLDICHVVAEYCIMPDLLDWIPQEDLEWPWLCQNPAAIHMLETNPNKIYWEFLSLNPAAIHLLEANPDKIYWPWLCQNPTSLAINLLEANPDKINWGHLSRNPAAIHLLKVNPNKVDYRRLSSNPAIFESDIKRIKLLANWLNKL